MSREKISPETLPKAPRDVASYLYNKNIDLLQGISTSEMSSKDPGLSEMKVFFSGVSDFILDDLLLKNHSLEEIKEKFSYYLKVGQEARAQGDWNTVFAIVNGLGHTSIFRLINASVLKLGESEQSSFDELRQLCNARNFFQAHQGEKINFPFIGEISQRLIYLEELEKLNKKPDEKIGFSLNSIAEKVEKAKKINSIASDYLTKYKLLDEKIREFSKTDTKNQNAFDEKLYQSSYVFLPSRSRSPAVGKKEVPKKNKDSRTEKFRKTVSDIMDMAQYSPPETKRELDGFLLNLLASQKHEHMHEMLNNKEEQVFKPAIEKALKTIPRQYKEIIKLAEKSKEEFSSDLRVLEQDRRDLYDFFNQTDLKKIPLVLLQKLLEDFSKGANVKSSIAVIKDISTTVPLGFTIEHDTESTFKKLYGAVLTDGQEGQMERLIQEYNFIGTTPWKPGQQPEKVLPQKPSVPVAVEAKNEIAQERVGPVHSDWDESISQKTRHFLDQDTSKFTLQQRYDFIVEIKAHRVPSYLRPGAFLRDLVDKKSGNQDLIKRLSDEYKELQALEVGETKRLFENPEGFPFKEVWSLDSKSSEVLDSLGITTARHFLLDQANVSGKISAFVNLAASLWPIIRAEYPFYWFDKDKKLVEQRDDAARELVSQYINKAPQSDQKDKVLKIIDIAAHSTTMVSMYEMAMLEGPEKIFNIFKSYNSAARNLLGTVEKVFTDPNLMARLKEEIKKNKEVIESRIKEVVSAKDKEVLGSLMDNKDKLYNKINDLFPGAEEEDVVRLILPDVDASVVQQLSSKNIPLTFDAFKAHYKTQGLSTEEIKMRFVKAIDTECREQGFNIETNDTNTYFDLLENLKLMTLGDRLEAVNRINPGLAQPLSSKYDSKTFFDAFKALKEKLISPEIQKLLGLAVRYAPKERYTKEQKLNLNRFLKGARVLPLSFEKFIKGLSQTIGKKLEAYASLLARSTTTKLEARLERAEKDITALNEKLLPFDKVKEVADQLGISQEVLGAYKMVHDRMKLIEKEKVEEKQGVELSSASNDKVPPGKIINVEKLAKPASTVEGGTVYKAAGDKHAGYVQKTDGSITLSLAAGKKEENIKDAAARFADTHDKATLTCGKSKAELRIAVKLANALLALKPGMPITINGKPYKGPRMAHNKKRIHNQTESFHNKQVLTDHGYTQALEQRKNLSAPNAKTQADEQGKKVAAAMMRPGAKG